VLPGWAASTYAVGSPVPLDFGLPANSSTTYTYQIYRDGVAITGAAGSSGQAIATYTPVTADRGSILSFSVYATNALGNSETVYSASVFIN
jgi:hypothetical protein